jgi:hypothetical protein
MSVNKPEQRKPKSLLAFVVWSLCGAAIGFVAGMVIVKEFPGGVFTAIGGALFGGAVGGKIIRTTGWTMLVGAIVGGVAAIIVTGIGKAVIYGVPFGAVVGLVLGLVLENYEQKRLCRLLVIAAAKCAAVRGSLWSSYNSGSDLGKFLLECKEDIEQGTIDLAHKKELWGIFAPTCDWDDNVGDVDLGNEIFELVAKLYGDEIKRSPQ